MKKLTNEKRIEILYTLSTSFRDPKLHKQALQRLKNMLQKQSSLDAKELEILSKLDEFITPDEFLGLIIELRTETILKLVEESKL